MILICNGQVLHFDQPVTIHDVLKHHGYDGHGIAVALNCVVVPRAQWNCNLADNDQLEIVTAVQGG